MMSNSTILKDIVAYVEVRSSNDNRSAAIRQELQSLGAKVETSFTDEVTHVVFKEGMKRTKNKALKRGIPLVSVSWLESCKQNERRMPEMDFQVVLPEDESKSPVKCLKNQNSRWKKMKSMQPCDFDEELARSAERGEKRRRRQITSNRLKYVEKSTPVHSPSLILAPETQPRSPTSFDWGNDSPFCQSTVPDTPQSMKERLERMRKEKKLVLGNEDASPAAAPRSLEAVPLQRKLFQKLASDLWSTKYSSDEDNDSTSEAVVRLIKGLESSNDSTPASSQTSDEASLYAGEESRINPEEVCLQKSKNMSQKISSHTNSAKENIEARADNLNKKLRRSAAKQLNSEAVGGKVNSSDIHETLQPCKSKDIRAKPLEPQTYAGVDVLRAWESNRRPSADVGATKSDVSVPQKAAVLNENSSTSVSSTANVCSGTGDYSKEHSTNCLSEAGTSKDMLPSKSVEKDSRFHVICTLKPKPKKKNLFSETVSIETLLQPVEQQKNKPSQDACEPNSKKFKSKEISEVDFLFGLSDRNSGERGTSGRRRSSRLKGSAGKTEQEQKEESNRKSEGDSRKYKNLEKLRGLNVKSCQDTSVRDTTLGTSMSVMYPNDSVRVQYMTHLSNPRRSLDEFSNKSDLMEKMKRKLSASRNNLSETSAKIKNLKRKQDDISSTGDKLLKNDSSSLKRKKNEDGSVAMNTNVDMSSNDAPTETAPGRLRHAHSLVMNYQALPVPRKLSYTLVVTSLHRHEQEIVYSVVKKLRAFHMTNDVEASSTHVVCGEARRTLNVLRAIARGCWLLRKEWVLESLEADHWLQEELYEMNKEFPAAKVSRCQRQKAGEGYKVDLFSKLGPIFVSDLCTPPRKHVVELITLCSGQVIGSEKRAAIHIKDFPDHSRPTVQPRWVLDCIENLKSFPVENYILHASTHSQRESSPEF